LKQSWGESPARIFILNFMLFLDVFHPGVGEGCQVGLEFWLYVGWFAVFETEDFLVYG